MQLEGLVGDEAMLENIASERNLIEVLQELSVNYYIATDVEQIDGCWRAQEPSLPGKYAPRMRAKLCYQPLLH